MIISHRHRFIFIKTNKTAGTSVEIVLSRYCGEEDVITPISPEDEKFRLALGYRGAQNFRISRQDTEPYTPGAAEVMFYNHMPAVEISALVGRVIWDGYFKFCFERNPWDRAISLYYWLYPEWPRPDFKNFLRSPEILRLKEKGHQLYTLDGGVAVDRICRFEALEDELQQVCRMVELPTLGPLPRAKARFRSDRRPYQEVMDESDRDLVASLFADEIKLMGYVF